MGKKREGKKNREGEKKEGKVRETVGIKREKRGKGKRNGGNKERKKK